MLKEIILPHESLPFSKAVKSGQLIFVSGLTGKGKNIEEQTRVALNDVKTTLEKARASLENVVKTSIFLSDGKDFDSMNKVYKEFFPKDFPARTTVQASPAKKEYLIEIEVIAVMPRKR